MEIVFVQFLRINKENIDIETLKQFMSNMKMSKSNFTVELYTEILNDIKDDFSL